MTEVQLSYAQRAALECFERGENMFLTGPAGTGKSFLIDQMEKSAERAGKRLQITAMTGVAAILLGKRARTLHSWSGIKLAQDEPEVTAKKVLKVPKSRKSWMSADILVVDEVSMMSRHILDTLYKIRSELNEERNIVVNKLDENGVPIKAASAPAPAPNQKPQLIFVGDMFQLPPVGFKKAEREYCFESEHWYELFPPQNHIELKTIFRQKDAIYAGILNEIREGHISESSQCILETRIMEAPEHATRFFPKRDAVEKINQRAFESLPTEPTYTYPVMSCTTMRYVADTGEPVSRKKWTEQEGAREVETLKNAVQMGTLVLRKGALVMCKTNLDIQRGIVNGSQGKVIDFAPGQMLKTFDQNVAYTLPVVRYNNGEVVTMQPNMWQSANEPTVAISQIPLVPCWAMTIHKSQGATLDIAEMDVGNEIFENGQAYVALSRVKTLEGLYLRHLNVGKIRADPTVKEFYSRIRTVNNGR